MLLQSILEMVIGFGIGSIPFGIIVCNQMRLASPKTYGSKNIGASNVARQNIFAGVLTLLLDASKGYLAILLLSANPYVVFAVVAGHCYSPLLKFNGGKGVATAGGALAAANPPVAIVLLSLWSISFLRNKVPATASISTSVLLLIYAVAGQSIWLALVSLMIIIRHKSTVTAKPQPA